MCFFGRQIIISLCLHGVFWAGQNVANLINYTVEYISILSADIHKWCYTHDQTKIYQKINMLMISVRNSPQWDLSSEKEHILTLIKMSYMTPNYYVEFE